MTVKQLKEELSKYPDDMPVFVGERLTEFDFGQINEVSWTEIYEFNEEELETPMKIVVISEQ